jgi:DNA repair exonuclease SbcCD ATPase subunit
MLIGLAMVFTAACLAADDLPPQPETKAPSQETKEETGAMADLQREWEGRMKQLRDAEDRQEAVNQQIGEENAEHKAKVASLDAEHRVKLAALEKEMLRAGAAVNAAQREANRLANEMNRRRMQAGGPPNFGGVGGFGARGGFGEIGGRGGAPFAQAKSENRPGMGRGAPGQTADQKLDAILAKLEQLEARLGRVEADQRRGGNRR